MNPDCVLSGEVVSRAPGNGLFLEGDGIQLLAVAFKVAEAEAGFEGELKGCTGDNVPGGEDEERGSGLPGEIAETVPGGCGDAAHFLNGVEEEIEDEERKVAVVQKEVAAAQGLIGIMTTNPEEAGTGIRTVGRRVEGIAAVDECERFISGREGTVSGGGCVLKQFGEDEGEPAGRVKRSAFRESSGREDGKAERARLGGMRELFQLVGMGKLLP